MQEYKYHFCNKYIKPKNICLYFPLTLGGYLQIITFESRNPKGNWLKIYKYPSLLIYIQAKG